MRRGTGSVSTELEARGHAGVLVGVGDTNLTLQPLALESSKGLGIAGGGGYLTLKSAD